MGNPFEDLMEMLREVEYKVEKIIKMNLNEDGFNKDEFVKVEEAAEYMGLKKSTLYAYARERKLRHYKRGANLYFSKKEINDYIRKGLVEEKGARKVAPFA